MMVLLVLFFSNLLYMLKFDPHKQDVNEKSLSLSDDGTLKMIACSPKGLIGNLISDTSIETLDKVTQSLSHIPLLNGGEYIPRCLKPHKVAIIVPFRKRETQLVTFRRHMHPILSRQGLNYRIYVVEEMDDMPFNRAKLLNVGYVQASMDKDYDCYIFHDVDFLLANDHLIYNCTNSPAHFGVSASQNKHSLPYWQYFGGVVAFNKNDFIRVNAFSNCYWGYGGEDDDMYKRYKLA